MQHIYVVPGNDAPLMTLLMVNRKCTHPLFIYLYIFYEQLVEYILGCENSLPGHSRP